MLELKKVLLTTDFSEAAQHALPHAVEAAGRFGAELTIVHCRTIFTDDPRHPEHQFLDEEKYEEFLKESIRSASEGVIVDLPIHAAVCRSVAPAAGILEHALDNNFDMIVMGTHGRSALAHFFLGSVAEKVVRHAHCPVLTVGAAREGYRENPVYKRLLAPFDFSEYSVNSVHHATEVADLYGAHLTVFYVVEQQVHPAFFATWRESIEHKVEEIEENVREALTKLLGKDEVIGLEVVVKIGDDRADNEIRRFCQNNDIDLVVMGTHGLSGLDRALLGSTTERVVRIAPCPVLTFKRP